MAWIGPHFPFFLLASQPDSQSSFLPQLFSSRSDNLFDFPTISNAIAAVHYGRANNWFLWSASHSSSPSRATLLGDSAAFARLRASSALVGAWAPHLCAPLPLTEPQPHPSPHPPPTPPSAFASFGPSSVCVSASGIVNGNASLLIMVGKFCYQQSGNCF